MTFNRVAKMPYLASLLAGIAVGIRDVAIFALGNAVKTGLSRYRQYGIDSKNRIARATADIK